ncbi:hypothetical protein LPJ72_004951 [Coemansia sp. Benny D160-2]|nr:hypothetical protein LPJ72_004951 [Coemansia sp. Benny D160-2]
MAVQIIVLALVFYLGYQYALTRKTSQVTNHDQPPSENSESPPAKSNDNDQQRKNKKPKQNKKKKQKNQSAGPAPKHKQPSAELGNPPAGTGEPEKPDNSLKGSERPLEVENPDESDSTPRSPSPNTADEWESARRTDSARAANRASSAAISVHPTRWERLDSNENLDHDLNPAPAQPRVLRIGAPVGPPRQDPPRIRYDRTPEPKQLTKSQRQTQRRMQKRREERAEAAAIQEHRLRQHRIQLEETRSREQWEKAKRAKAKQQQQGSHGSKATAGPSFIDGKLIWD